MFVMPNPMTARFQVAGAIRAQHRLLTGVLAISLLTISAGATAGSEHQHVHDHADHADHRQHGAHVHGVADLNLALEGTELQLELHGPAANIVGFEHAPATEAHHATLDEAVATLEDGDRLFLFNQEAGCRMQEASVTSELLDPEQSETDGQKGRDSDHHHHARDDEMKDPEGHHHDAHAHDGETHADITAAYRFECDAPGKLKQLTVTLFETFAAKEKIKVQYVIENKQGAAELTASKPVVRF